MFWIEKAWGDTVNNATMDDVRVAIQETVNMDDEHGAFWAGNMDYENVMEVHKDLELFYIYNDNLAEQLKVKLTTWNEAESLYKLFFDNNFEQVENEVRRRINEQ